MNWSKYNAVRNLKTGLLRIVVCLAVAVMLAACTTETMPEKSRTDIEHKPRPVPAKIERGKIHLEKPKEMIVKATTRFCLYPGEEESSGFELAPGKVVRTKEKYRDWYNVDIITYDTPYAGDKWVKKSVLIQYSPGFAREGYLKPGANVHEDSGAEKISKDQFNFRNNPVIINESENDMYGISTAGGAYGFIKKDDFIPNPFQS